MLYDFAFEKEFFEVINGLSRGEFYFVNAVKVDSSLSVCNQWVEGEKELSEGVECSIFGTHIDNIGVGNGLFSYLIFKVYNTSFILSAAKLMNLMPPVIYALKSWMVLACSSLKRGVFFVNRLSIRMKSSPLKYWLMAYGFIWWILFNRFSSFIWC